MISNSQEGKVRQAIKFCSTIEPPPCRPSWRYKNGSDHHHLHHPLWNRDRPIASKSRTAVTSCTRKAKRRRFLLARQPYALLQGDLIFADHIAKLIFCSLHFIAMSAKTMSPYTLLLSRFTNDGLSTLQKCMCQFCLLFSFLSFAVLVKSRNYHRQMSMPEKEQTFF